MLFFFNSKNIFEYLFFPKIVLKNHMFQDPECILHTLLASYDSWVSLHFFFFCEIPSLLCNRRLVNALAFFSNAHKANKSTQYLQFCIVWWKSSEESTMCYEEIGTLSRRIYICIKQRPQQERRRQITLCVMSHA